MTVGTPDNSKQVEDRIKADVQREAPDSNPYLTVHWLRSLIAGIARRIFDLYRDLNRTEKRLFPDTADDETAPRWGNIYVGAKIAASAASGTLVATGNPGGVIGIGVSLAANGIQYITTTSGAIANNSISILSITRSGSITTVITDGDHNLSSFVPVTITGADQSEYNITDGEIVITGTNSFTFNVSGSPVTPATGTISAEFTTANVNVQSVTFGDDTNLDSDTAVTLQSPLVDVDDTLYVTFGEIGGGTEEESTANYKARYLDKIRNPVAHFNEADIIAKAKGVAGVTRVFVEKSGTEVGSILLSSLTRNGNVATAVSVDPHGFNDGQITSITGAIENEYNVINTRLIIEDEFIFHFIVLGTPATPATGTINASSSIPLGQVRTFFMRDNDSNPIPSASEVQAVKDALSEILPANTADADNIVLAPSPVTVDYVLTNLVPNTTTMRAAIEENIAQFHEEQTSVGVNVDEDAYRSAIINTVDPDTGDTVQTFDLATPVGDITINSGEIAIKGTVTF